jgi:hypothetical protein
MDLRQAVKWRPDNAYRATRCRPAVATPRSSGSPQPMQIELASIGDRSIGRYSPGSARPTV